MVSFPVLITRSVLVLDSKKSKQLVSVTFIAKFSDGSEKFLNTKGWEPIGLLKTSFLGEQGLPKNECCLYYKDWSKNPTFGTMRDNYPSSILPSEISNLQTNHISKTDKMENTTLSRKELQFKIQELYINYTNVFLTSIPNGEIEQILKKRTENLELVYEDMVKQVSLLKSAN